ncbi:MAG: ribokinase, partial [Clostridiaceae bacterium]
MSKQLFDTFIIGQPSLDINTDYDGTTISAYGGAVVYSGYAAGALGHPTAVLPKANLSKTDVAALFADAKNVTIYPVNSANGTSISNVYHTADRERRTCKAISSIEPYRITEIPDVDAKIYHLAGLVHGDIGEEIIAFSAKKAKVAVDVQCLLRWVENGDMVFHDWAQKKEYLPMIDYLKTDAAEAEILTGLSDRTLAAKQLFDWGAKEVMITHNTEVLVYDGETV